VCNALLLSFSEVAVVFVVFAVAAAVVAAVFVGRGEMSCGHGAFSTAATHSFKSRVAWLCFTRKFIAQTSAILLELTFTTYTPFTT